MYLPPPVSSAGSQMCVVSQVAKMLQYRLRFSLAPLPTIYRVHRSHRFRFLLEAGADPNNPTDGGDLPGDQFDSVFVPSAPSRVDRGGDGGEEEEEGPRGPREDIIALLENARAAKQGAPVAANGA